MQGVRNENLSFDAIHSNSAHNDTSSVATVFSSTPLIYIVSALIYNVSIYSKRTSAKPQQVCFVK